MTYEGLMEIFLKSDVRYSLKKNEMGFEVCGPKIEQWTTGQIGMIHSSKTRQLNLYMGKDESK